MNLEKIVFHVSPLGNDQNSGSAEQPFLSLKCARDAARKIRGEVPNRFPYICRDPDNAGDNEKLFLWRQTMPERPAVQIVLHGGEYRLTELLRLNASDSGTIENPVVWEAARGETPVIKGSITLTGWEQWKDGVWRAPLPDSCSRHFSSRELFYKGQRMTRSRYPKADPTQPGRRGAWAWPSEIPAEDNLRSFVLPKDWPRPYARPDEGEVNMGVGHGGWCNNIIPIESINPTTGLLRTARKPIELSWIPWSMTTPFSTANRFYIENMLEDVERPGEWCLVHAERMIYFRPPEGETFDPAQVELPMLGQLIDVESCSHITFKGITFTQCRQLGDNYHRFGNTGYGAMHPQPDWKYAGEAVRVAWSNHIDFESCTFDQVGANALYFERDVRRSNVRRCTFSHVGCNPVVFIGDRVDHPLGCRVEDCHIHHGGDILNYVAGVFCGVSDGIRIAHNHIHDMPHHAVNLATNGLGRNYVENNRIERVTLEIADTGAINSWMDDPCTAGEPSSHHAERSGHVIRGNWISHVQGCISEHGKVKPDSTARAIYLDDGTSNCVVTDNIIVDVAVGMQIHAGRHNLVENNIIIDALVAVLVCNDPANRRGSGFNRLMNRMNRFRRNIVLSRLDKYHHWYAPENEHKIGSLHWFTQASCLADEFFEICDENLYWYPKTNGLRVDLHLPPPYKDNVWRVSIPLDQWRKEYGHDL
ncbi:MAG: right-handed parallel beta-helix repeat-containing protein, partial [Verrucomicrobiae bacterium]|nr:right-handed parallel beta-helix repeat-containing protein [Verrucomicrobiae bacterium]